MTLIQPKSIVESPFPVRPSEETASCIIKAAGLVCANLEKGVLIEACILRKAMEAAFGGSDAEGLWTWKTAYEACEVAQVLFLRKYGSVMLARTATKEALLAMLTRMAALLPTHTRRTQESEALQQFSTPTPLGLIASLAADIGPNDLVLEPSAGTGLLAIFAEMRGAHLVLNEVAPVRAALLRQLFSNTLVTSHDAANIHDRLDETVRPSVILMNPPFSATLNVSQRTTDAAFQHISSAFARLAQGGRLVTITGAAVAPDNPVWRSSFVRLQEKGGYVRASFPIDGAVYTKHGTTFSTRLTVIDKTAAPDVNILPPSENAARNTDELLSYVTQFIPPRKLVSEPIRTAKTTSATIIVAATPKTDQEPRIGGVSPLQPADDGELTYELVHAPEAADKADLTDALYESYALSTIRIPCAKPHPTTLVQSASMASVRPPVPSYRPHMLKRLVTEGTLSDAQIESIIFAGEAHAQHLAGSWSVDETRDNLHAATKDADNAVRFRRGWFLGDGTGCGKGRQVSGIILDNWLKGRRKAIWISKSDKLIEDARRDWASLGQEQLLVQPLSRFKQGSPITLSEGILFCTYATLRSAERGDKISRLQQVVNWFGKDFDGVIVFDEAHALANAAGCKGERGNILPSQQGRAGLRLQRALPDARIVYVSATGATDVRNLAYAERLGLWGSEDFPFANRSEFVQAVEAGGVAAMEVLARDLKALGLYAARSLSYEGVEVDILEHPLTPEQVAIYDAYADAFQIIHQNLTSALEASNVTGTTGALNGQAKCAARSAFESAKQRFFSHLLTSMKTTTLVKSVEADLAAGHAAVIQIVSTGEAVMERKLAEIPTEEWNDLTVDLSPREIVGSYLSHAFPTQLFERYTDEEGNLCSRPAFDAEGNPVQCREAVAARNSMLEHLATLDPVPGALDQIVRRFGADRVAEVTGRSRRIVKKGDRLAVETRPPSANLVETQSFMDDEKHILVFSDAGGTGRSYHADRGAKNQRLRVHYLLEAGWKADTAIQGLGRSNRTNQAQPPLFRPMTTDVKAEKRFLSTIARRLDTLGAITRGQRQTGGQGLFRAEDNLEGEQARAALRQFYMLLAQGSVEGCSLRHFEDTTGLSLLAESGGLKEELPPIITFLNRLLALPIALQNTLFTAFEDLLNARTEAAIAAGTHDVGMETIRAESLIVTDRRTVWKHDSGAVAQLFTIQRKDRNRPMSSNDALSIPEGNLLINSRSHRAAVQIAASSLMLDDGRLERRVRLIRPLQHETVPLADLSDSYWEQADKDAFRQTWETELATIPAFTVSTFHLVTGLLLPIWRRLPEKNARVYRIQTDAGERIVGRVLSSIEAEAVCKNLGIDAPKLDKGDVWELVSTGKATAHLSDGFALRRALVMNEHRLELTGFTSGMVEGLKARGLFGEIISWKLRLFVPNNSAGKSIVTELLERWPLTEIIERS